MKKNLKELWQRIGMLMILTSCIILLQMVVGVLLWDRLPDRIATHFDFQNRPNGWTSKGFTVFGMPLVLLALHWICLLSTCAQRDGERVYRGKVKYLLLFIIPAVSVLVTVMCYGYALNMNFHIGRMVLVFLGVLFALTGNYMPKIRRNWFAGIKLPWTLMDDENWEKTHRMAAPVWVVCGLALVGFGLIGYTTWLAFAVIMAMVLLPTGYSLWLHIKARKNEE